MPTWKDVTFQTTNPDGSPTTQTVSVLDKNQTNTLLQSIQASVLSVTGQGGNGSNIHGPLSMNGFPISNVDNSSPPLPTEALSYSTAQARYQAWRQAGTAQKANYTVQASDGTIQVDASAGGVTVTLPAPDTVAWYVFPVIKIDSSGNAVTVKALNTSKGAAATINGAASASLAAQWNKAQYQSTGTAYIIIG
jgi:hypothetical protein